MSATAMPRNQIVSAITRMSGIVHFLRERGSHQRRWHQDVDVVGTGRDSEADGRIRRRPVHDQHFGPAVVTEPAELLGHEGRQALMLGIARDASYGLAVWALGPDFHRTVDV